MPPKLTAVTPVKLVPVIVTVDPASALDGVKPVIVTALPHAANAKIMIRRNAPLTMCLDIMTAPFQT